MSSSSTPLVSSRIGRTASLFQNHQAPRYGWWFMFFRERVAHTALLQPRPAFYGNFAPCLERLSDQLLCRYEVNAVALPILQNKRPGRQDCCQQFLCCYEVALRNKTAARQSVRYSQFFSVIAIASRRTDLSKIETGCCNVPSDKNTAGQNLRQERRQQPFSYFIIA